MILLTFFSCSRVVHQPDSVNNRCISIGGQKWNIC